MALGKLTMVIVDWRSEMRLGRHIFAIPFFFSIDAQFPRDECLWSRGNFGTSASG